MANPIVTHVKVSPAPLGPNSNLVYGPDWNANHVVTGLENVPNVDTTNAANITSGTLPAGRFPALTGDVTTTVGTVATTITANAVTNAQAAQMAANTVKGNNLGSTANAADLTIAQLLALYGTPSGSLYGAQGSFWIDITDADGAANARIHPFRDRLFVDDGAPNTGAWASGAGGLPNTRSGTAINGATWNWAPRDGSLVAISSWGGLSIVGQSVASRSGRSGDPHAAGASATIGVAGFGLNDTTVNQGNVWGGYFEALKKTSTSGTSLAVELDTGNVGTTVDITPYSSEGPATGATVGIWNQSGGSSGTVVTYTNCSASMAIGNNGARWRKGIVVKNVGLDTAVGAGGAGVAMEMARGQSIRWQNSIGSTDAEMFATSSGLQINAGNTIVGTLLETVGVAYTAYTPTVTALAGTITTASAAGRFRQLGKTIFFQININITTNGTGATAVVATLPVQAAAFQYSVNGRDALTGKMLNGTIAGSATTVFIQNYDGSYPAANGDTLTVSGTYESI